MKNYLLSIGVGKYENEGRDLLSLEKVPKNDCNRLAEVLCSDLYGFEYVQKPLFDKHASYDAIVSALKGLTELEEDSQLVIHFSGHGEYRTDRNMSYWLAHEAVVPSKFNPHGDLKKQGWISAEEIVKKVNAASSRHVLILADCCYAGHMRYNYRGMGGYLYPDYAKLAIRTKSREILSPCSVTLTSSSTGDKSVSEFTKCIADKLKKKSKFAVISPPILYGELLSLHHNTWNAQYGHLQGVSEPGGYFLFASPKRLDAIYKEPYELDNKVHQVFCSKIEQKLKPISSAIDRSRYLDGFVGRQWVFDEVNAWVANPKSRLFWLTGEPGIGKSAVSAYLAEHHEVTSAHHFFLFDKAATLDLRQVTRSLAYQLAQVLPDYANHIDQLDDQRLHELDGQSLFDDLIITPLAHVVTSPNVPVVILLDGLDEASSDGKNEIAEYVAKLIDTAPAWLKILFTSRTREPEINRSLGKHSPWELDAEDSRNAKDLTLYLKKHLPKCTAHPKLLGAILDKSEGSFLYIKHLCDDWKHCEDLPDIHQLPTGLSGIYEQFFRRQFSEIEDYEDQTLPILELIIGAFEPLSVQELAEFSGTSERHIQKVKRLMGSLLRETKGKLEFCHKSLPDWLVSAPSSEFNVTKPDAQKRLAQIGWKLYTDNPNVWSSYFLKHLVKHLVQAGWRDCGEQVLLNFKYLEEKVRNENVYVLISEISDYADCPVLAELRRALLFGAQTANQHPKSLFQNIYIKLDDQGFENLKASVLVESWYEFKKKCPDFGLIKNIYRSSSTPANFFYTTYIAPCEGRLLGVKNKKVFFADGIRFKVADLNTGRILFERIHPFFSKKKSLFVPPRLYFIYGSDSITECYALRRTQCTFRLTENDARITNIHQLFSGEQSREIFCELSREDSERRHLYLVNFQSKSLVRILSAKSSICSVSKLRDFIAVGLENGTVILLNKRSGWRLTVNAHRKKVSEIVVLDEAFVTRSKEDGSVKKWRIRDGTLLSVVRCDQPSALYVDMEAVWIGANRGDISLWNGDSTINYGRFHLCAISKLFYDKQEQVLVSQGETDGKISVSHVAHKGNSSCSMLTSLGNIVSIRFSECGQFLLTTTGNGLFSFKIDTMKFNASLTSLTNIRSTVNGDESACVYIATLDGKIIKACVETFQTTEVASFPEFKIHSMVHCREKRTLLISCEGRLVEYDLRRQEIRQQSIYNHSNRMTAVDLKQINGGVVSAISLQNIYQQCAFMTGAGWKGARKRLRLSESNTFSRSKAIERFNPKDWVFSQTDYSVLASFIERGTHDYILGSTSGELVLMRLADKQELAWIPGRYDILLKHPTRSLWAAVQDNILSFFTYETGSVSQG